jgi:hypothetical protein
MSTTESNHATTFIIFFSVIALAINSLQFHQVERARAVQQQVFQQQQQAQVDAEKKMEEQKAAQQAEAARVQAIQQATVRHAQYVAQYVNSSFSKTTGTESLAVLVVNQQGQFDDAICTAIANRFKSGAVSISTSLFKPKFVTDNLFDNLFGGSTDILNRLDLANSLDALLLAKEAVEYSKSPALDNVITAHLTLEIQLVPVLGSTQTQSWKFTSNGAGFSQTEAVSMAEDRIIKQISNDTKMSLSN